MDEMVYLNGNLITRREATISVMDYGFLYGYGLFETMHAYNGVVFRLERHLHRLASSAKLLDIPVNTSLLESAVRNTLQANLLKEARVRLTISAGEGSMVPDLSSCHQPTVLVTAATYIPYKPEIYARGFQVIVSSIRRNSHSPLSQMKTANYLASLFSRREARSGGADDTILLNENDYVAEASSSNVFLYSGNILQTPRLENGLLPGITRETIIELAKQRGIRVQEVDIRPDELLAADEIFLTNSMIEIMPVTTCNGKKIGSGKPGPMTQSLMEAYKRLVSQETLI